MKAWVNWRYNSTIFTSALDGGECSASRPGRFTPGEIARGAHARFMGGWVGPKAGLDAVEMRKIFPCQKSNPGRPARTRRYADWLHLGIHSFIFMFVTKLSCLFYSFSLQFAVPFTEQTAVVAICIRDVPDYWLFYWGFFSAFLE
jgi:hypothetical protein